MGVPYHYLDGATPARERRKRVEAFQAGDGDLFLISLRAGGTGLNLTAADYVIHLDPWWNPAVEDQASHRAHRIGRTRVVTVYRLVGNGTIEEKIVDLHRRKRILAERSSRGPKRQGGCRWRGWWSCWERGKGRPERRPRSDPPAP
jgi:SNF2 family DNA or RNA helicase